MSAALLEVGRELAAAARLFAYREVPGMETPSDEVLREIVADNSAGPRMCSHARDVLRMREAVAAWEKASSCEAGVSLGGLPPSSQTQAPNAVQVTTALTEFRQHAVTMVLKDSVIPGELLVLIAHLRDGLRKLLGAELACPEVEMAAASKGQLGTPQVPPVKFLVRSLSTSLTRALKLAEQLQDTQLVTSLLFSVIGSAVAGLPDDFFADVVDHSERPCGCLGCECEELRGPLMRAIAGVRLFAMDEWRKMQGGQANG